MIRDRNRPRYNEGVLVVGLGLAVLATACLPRTGHVTIYGDGAAQADQGAGQLPDTGPRPDGQPPKLDTAAPKLETGPPPAGPQPPFGTTQGMTAKNFTGVPDCAGTNYSLHSFYQQKRGVIIAMMSPS